MSTMRSVVKSSTMANEMQEAAIQVAQDAIAEHFTTQEIASSIKANFEKAYPGPWHCFVGGNFGCTVTHEASKFVYFYIGQTGICLFSTA